MHVTICMETLVARVVRELIGDGTAEVAVLVAHGAQKSEAMCALERAFPESATILKCTTDELWVAIDSAPRCIAVLGPDDTRGCSATLLLIPSQRAAAAERLYVQPAREAGVALEVHSVV